MLAIDPYADRIIEVRVDVFVVSSDPSTNCKVILLLVGTKSIEREAAFERVSAAANLCKVSVRSSSGGVNTRVRDRVVTDHSAVLPVEKITPCRMQAIRTDIQ